MGYRTLSRDCLLARHETTEQSIAIAWHVKRRDAAAWECLAAEIWKPWRTFHSTLPSEDDMNRRADRDPIRLFRRCNAKAGSPWSSPISLRRSPFSDEESRSSDIESNRAPSMGVLGRYLPAASMRCEDSSGRPGKSNGRPTADLAAGAVSASHVNTHLVSVAPLFFSLEESSRF